MKKFFLGLVLALGVIAVAFLIQFWRATSATRAELAAASAVVETSKGPVEYRAGGAGERVLLFIHGTPGGHDQGGAAGELAAANGWRILVPSRPGYLRTPLATGRTPAEQGDVYAALLDALDIRRVAILGVSGGGPSALEFAARHPDRCVALVHLMGVSRPRRADEDGPGGESPSLLRRFQRTNLGGWLIARAALRDPAALVPTVIPDPENQRRVLDSPERLEGFKDVVASALLLAGDRSAGAENDHDQFAAMPVAALESISAPTLVVHGTADTNVPIAMGALVAKRVPGARMLTIEGGDHFVFLTHTEEVFGAIFEFLDPL